MYKKNRRCYQFEQNFEIVRWNKEINRTTKKQSFKQVHVQNKKHQKKNAKHMQNQKYPKKKKKKKKNCRPSWPFAGFSNYFKKKHSCGRVLLAQQ
jgi:hypothetical protein